MQFNKMRGLKHPHKAIFLGLLVSFILHSSPAQDLKFFIELAEKNYPSIAAKKAEADAARTKVSLEKRTVLPSLDAAYQANLSTYNNISGLSFPGTLIPISGPPTSENNYDLVPGTAASLVMKWSPIAFGQRSAAIESSRQYYEKQLASIENEALRVKFQVAFMYLEIMVTSELIKVYHKNIERNETNLKQVATLAAVGIKSTVDSLKFEGELSKARTELYKLENLFEMQKSELQELLMLEELKDIDTNRFFLENLPSGPSMKADFIGNPQLRMAKHDFDGNVAQLRQVSRSWAPNVEFWGTAFARGSGIGDDGIVNYAEGWSFSRFNYGVGIQVVFPILNLSDVQLKNHYQRALVRASESTLKQTEASLRKQESIALNDLGTRVKIAREVPKEYEANMSAYQALQTRFSVGLVDYAELIQAQYDLLNAEASLKTAYIDSWKALLKLSVIRGDLFIFLNQIYN